MCRFFKHSLGARMRAQESYLSSYRMGNVGFLGMINCLRKVKCDGWLTLEIHGDEGKILESKKLLENLIEFSGD